MAGLGTGAVTATVWELGRAAVRGVKGLYTLSLSVRENTEIRPKEEK